MDEQTIHNLNEEQQITPAERRGVSGREVVYGVLGVLAGLLVLSSVWFAANRRDSAIDLSQFTEINRPAADFELETINGGTVKLSEYRGKLVLLNFWRTDCIPCQDETPALQAAYEQLRDKGLVIIGVNMFQQEQAAGRGVDVVQQFATRYGAGYPIALDADGSVTQEYLVGSIPVSYLVDGNGTARFVRVGSLTTADVVALVQELEQRDAVAQGQ